VSALELVQRLIASEDEEAYRQFARLFYGRFYRYFLAAGLPPFEAEDQAETMITEIVVKFGKYEPRDGASFESWIYQLVRIAAVNWHRSQKGKKFEPIDNLAGILQSPESCDTWADPEVLSAVQDAMAKLSDVDRMMLELRDLGEDRIHEEIAGLLKITNNNARVRYFRARQHLRELLEADERIARRLTLPVAGR